MGMYVGSSIVVIDGIIEPETLESLDVREAFALADDFYVKMVHITTDRVMMINYLKAEYKGPSATVINDMKEKMKEY